jgi:hypothetical protein
MMRIQGNQFNPNLALDAAYEVQKAEAKREVAAIRKKLLDSATQSAADDDDFVVSISTEQQNSEQQPKQNKQQQETQDPSPGDESGHISDWA